MISPYQYDHRGLIDIVFCYVGRSAWNAYPDITINHFLCLLLDVSRNISTSHITSTPSALEVILQLTYDINYSNLLTYTTVVNVSM